MTGVEDEKPRGACPLSSKAAVRSDRMGGDGAAASAPLKAARAEAPRRGSCAGGAAFRDAPCYSLTDDEDPEDGKGLPEYEDPWL
eukprot:g1599.t1